MPLDFDNKMPIAKAIGFTAGVATTHLQKNCRALKWWFNDLSDLTNEQKREIYADIFKTFVESEPQNFVYPSEVPRPIVDKVIAEIIAAAKDLDSKGEL